MREKNQLEDYACKNPYKDQNVRNATTDAIDGVRFRDNDRDTELDYLTLCDKHVSTRKAYVRVIASGEECKLVKKLGNVDVKSKRQLYASAMEQLIKKNRNHYRNYYEPLTCFQTLGNFPEGLTNCGANRWESYVDETSVEVDRKRQLDDDDEDTREPLVKKKTRTMLARLLEEQNCGT
jgi:hypothetical protein